MPKSSAGPSTPFSRRVSQAIERLRIDAGVTQAQLFKDAGMSQNYFYVRLRGELPFNTNDISALAEALDLDPMSILREASRPGSIDGSNVVGYLDDAVHGLDAAAGTDETQADDE